MSSSDFLILDFLTGDLVALDVSTSIFSTFTVFNTGSGGVSGAGDGDETGRGVTSLIGDGLCLTWGDIDLSFRTKSDLSVNFFLTGDICSGLLSLRRSGLRPRESSHRFLGGDLLGDHLEDLEPRSWLLGGLR